MCHGSAITPVEHVARLSTRFQSLREAKPREAQATAPGGGVAAHLSSCSSTSGTGLPIPESTRVKGIKGKKTMLALLHLLI